MENISITTSFTVYSSVEELPEDVRELMQKAVAARKNAYAPYSRFRVGAAVLLANGITVQGSNQENAAFPSGLCAERVAVFYAGASYPGIQINKLAITAASDEKEITDAVPPCGACRQSLAEYEMRQDAPIEIWFMGNSGKIYRSESLKNLLPLVFDSTYL